MQTKILVLRKNRLAIGLIALCAALLLFLFFTFRSSSGDPAPAAPDPAISQKPEATYRAGVYTSTIALGDSLLNLELVLDSNHINSVRLVNLEESVTTMYPLIEPSLNALAEQLVGGVAPADIKLDDNKKYTQSLLMEVINATLKKAAVE
ncbi:MAG: hypothetical protein K2N94_00415 [Lachnospiraceae bacterium]|nr:hypothetical protein [Lachnospiraceae bacterium]